MSAITRWHLRDDWRELRRSRPGRRFQDRYARVHRQARTTSLFQRIALLAAGVLFLVLGGFFAVMPGPALPFFFLAGGLFASESLIVARFMDWSETRVRRLARWARPRWRRLPAALRVAVALVAVGCSLGGAYFSYRFFRD